MATEREGGESGERVPGTGEAQNASGSNAHTRSSAGTPKDPLSALSRTAHRIGEPNPTSTRRSMAGLSRGRSRSKSVWRPKKAGAARAVRAVRAAGVRAGAVHINWERSHL